MGTQNDNVLPDPVGAHTQTSRSPAHDTLLPGRLHSRCPTTADCRRDEGRGKGGSGFQLQTAGEMEEGGRGKGEEGGRVESWHPFVFGDTNMSATPKP